MDGVGVPLVTPFTPDGDVDEPALRDLVTELSARGVDFIVPCGSNSEAELLTASERERVVDVVADAADGPVLAGTGHPGLAETRRATADAAEAGADAALVVTPFYYDHDESAIETYYRDVADAAPIPVYLYNVPKYTGVNLSPEAVERLATHPNVAGMKDSSGDVAAFTRIVRRTADADFDPLVGSGGVFAHALAAGATGGVLALANVAPEACAEIYRRHAAGDDADARRLNEALVELNTGVTATYGVPGLKAAMAHRDLPAGDPRRPHQPATDETGAAVESLVDAAPLAEEDWPR